MTRTSFAVTDESAARELMEESQSNWIDIEETLDLVDDGGGEENDDEGGGYFDRRESHGYNNDHHPHGHSNKRRRGDGELDEIEAFRISPLSQQQRQHAATGTVMPPSPGAGAHGRGSITSSLASPGSGFGSTFPDPSEPFHVLKEAKQLFHVAIPSVLIQFSLSFIFPMSASIVGRTQGTTALGGYSLGTLIGNLTCLSIMEGALTAGDTLMPRAYGNHRYYEVACLAVRAFLVVVCLLIPPVLPLCWYSQSILIALGQDRDASILAQRWIQLYFLGVPANLMYRVCMRFLLCQHIPWPLVYTSVIPALVVHPIFLQLLVPKMGLPGSALAISMTQWFMMIMLGMYFYWKRNNPDWHPETWPGLSRKLVKDAVQIKPMLTFFSLALGGVLSLSEWWFWETMCFVAGSFGVVALCAHTVAYNLVPLLFMLPLGIMIGLAVRMGHVITYDPRRAKLMAAWCMGLIVVLATIIVTLLETFRVQIIQLFSSDPEVLEMDLHIWNDLCIYIFLIYIFGISNAVYRGLGMQWRLGIIVTGMLYVFLLPAVIYFAMIQGGGLYMQWTLMPSFYSVMQIVLILGYVFVDWDAHSKSIRDGLRASLRNMKRELLRAAEAAEEEAEAQLDNKANGVHPNEQTRLVSS